MQSPQQVVADGLASQLIHQYAVTWEPYCCEQGCRSGALVRQFCHTLHVLQDLVWQY
jgi:hypothetical protein